MKKKPQAEVVANFYDIQKLSINIYFTRTTEGLARGHELLLVLAWDFCFAAVLNLGC